MLFYRALVKELIIPLSVSMIEKDAFKDIPNLSGIYAEAAEKPDGWNAYWIDESYDVQWGYSQESND